MRLPSTWHRAWQTVRIAQAVLDALICLIVFWIVRTLAPQVRRAALAPAQPSAQDRKVAAQAAAAEREARTQLAEQRRTEQEDSSAGATAGATAQASPLAPNPSPRVTVDPDLARRYVSHDEPGSAIDLTV